MYQNEPLLPEKIDILYGINKNNKELCIIK